MKHLQITAWFFVITKDLLPSKNHDQYQLLALLGQKDTVIRDQYQLDASSLYTLIITKPYHQLLAQSIKTGREVFISGTLPMSESTNKKRFIHVQKIHLRQHRHLDILYS